MSKETKVEVLVLRIKDRKPSNWVLEGTADSSLPTRLDVSDGRRILERSVIKKMVEGVEKYIPIRYIAGCDTILVSEQDARGIKPNAHNDKIWFESGLKSIPKKGRDIGLFDYLKACEFNADAKERPDSAEALFEEVKTEFNAQKQIEEVLERSEALKMISELAHKENDVLVFEEEQINYLANLFGCMGLPTPAEKLQVISAIAQGQPKFFVNTIADTTSAIKAEVMQAVHHEALSIAGERASFRSTNYNFYTFKSKPKDKDSRIKELVMYMTTAEGKKDYTQMLADTQQKMNAKVEVV